MTTDNQRAAARDLMNSNWEDPAFREKITVTARETGREAMKRNWADPEFRKRMEEKNRNRPHPSGPDHPRWKGGEHKGKNGYVTVWTGTKNRLRSHVVWEQAHPDDPILPGEHIHHVNHVRDDDRPENLEKLPASAHQRLHKTGVPLSPHHRQRVAENNRAMKRTFTVKSCGKAHSGCKICQPERFGPEWRAKLSAGHKRRGTFPH